MQNSDTRPAMPLPKIPQVDDKPSSPSSILDSNSAATFEDPSTASNLSLCTNDTDADLDLCIGAKSSSAPSSLDCQRQTLVPPTNSADSQNLRTGHGSPLQKENISNQQRSLYSNYVERFPISRLQRVEEPATCAQIKISNKTSDSSDGEFQEATRDDDSDTDEEDDISRKRRRQPRRRSSDAFTAGRKGNKRRSSRRNNQITVSYKEKSDSEDSNLDEAEAKSPYTPPGWHAKTLRESVPQPETFNETSQEDENEGLPTRSCTTSSLTTGPSNCASPVNPNLTTCESKIEVQSEPTAELLLSIAGNSQVQHSHSGMTSRPGTSWSSGFDSQSIKTKSEKIARQVEGPDPRSNGRDSDNEASSQPSSRHPPSIAESSQAQPAQSEKAPPSGSLSSSDMTSQSFETRDENLAREVQGFERRIHWRNSSKILPLETKPEHQSSTDENSQAEAQRCPQGETASPPETSSSSDLNSQSLKPKTGQSSTPVQDSNSVNCLPPSIGASLEHNTDIQMNNSTLGSTYKFIESASDDHASVNSAGNDYPMQSNADSSVQSPSNPAEDLQRNIVKGEEIVDDLRHECGTFAHVVRKLLEHFDSQHIPYPPNVNEQKKSDWKDYKEPIKSNNEIVDEIVDLRAKLYTVAKLVCNLISYIRARDLDVPDFAVDAEPRCRRILDRFSSAILNIGF